MIFFFNYYDNDLDNGLAYRLQQLLNMSSQLITKYYIIKVQKNDMYTFLNASCIKGMYIAHLSEIGLYNLHHL